MKIQKLLRQFGEHGNDYSPIEMGDKINEIIDLLSGEQAIEGEPVPSVEKITLEEYPARCSSSGDRVYLIKNGKKSWIKNLETLKKLGWDLHKVKNITNEEMDGFEPAEATDLKDYEVSEVPETKDNGENYNL